MAVEDRDLFVVVLFLPCGASSGGPCGAFEEGSGGGMQSCDLVADGQQTCWSLARLPLSFCLFVFLLWGGRSRGMILEIFLDSSISLIYTSADPCIACTRMFVSVLSATSIRGPAQ